MGLSKSYNKAKNTYKVTFTIPLETATEVKVLGEFNDWDYDKGLSLKKKKNEFSGHIQLHPGEYQFRYLVNGSIWKNDEAADSYIDAPYDGIQNGVIRLPQPSNASSAPKKVKASKAIDFTIIEGIGPKINKLIKDAGIGSFQELSSTKSAKIKDILIAGGNRYKMHDPGTWPKQAGLVAKEDWAGLKKLQNKLKGGK